MTYRIGEYAGFRIFEPHESILEGSRRLVDLARRTNTAFLNDCVRLEDHAALPEISGSFICAHAPDYVGVPTLEWQEADWRQLFDRMVFRGIDTVVFQAAAWQELQECYYCSQYFRQFRQWNVIEPMLRAARACKLTVFLGGYGSVSGWRTLRDSAMLQRELAHHQHCLEELMEFRELFQGVYLAPETAFGGKRDPEQEQCLNRIYRATHDILRQMAPEKKLMLSPGSHFFPDRRQDFREAWLNLLDRIQVDVMAPQDSIGGCACTLPDGRAIWSDWKTITVELGARLWANIELFERRDFGGAAPFVPASPQRVATQLSNVRETVEKCICWEYSYFVDRPEGEALRRFFPQEA